MSAKGALTILFYPSFDNSEEFTDHYYRMLWYLNPLRGRIRRVIMPYEGEPPALGELPYYLDPAVRQIAESTGLASAVQLVGSEHIGPLQDAAKTADIVLVWRTDSSQHDRVPDAPLKPTVMKKKRYLVDHKRERYAGSFYLRLSSETCSDKSTVKESKEKFKRIPSKSLTRTGYIYGTGPSLKSAMDMDLSDGTSIICNTIVKNKELMRKLKPPIITVADPIFHAGCSSYAGDFRRHLVEAMIEYYSYLVVPMRDYALYMANLDPSLQERIIGVPIVPPNLSPNVVPNLNLYKKFQVAPATSILMLFLMPLAATLFEKTFMLGFDGRPLDQDDYFWRHDPASQLVDRMDDIQVAHPAFFAIDYQDFYLEHCRQVARWLEEAERQGRQFFSLTPSYVPALKSRYVPRGGQPVEPPEGAAKGQVHVISLNAHFADAFGHFLAYDSKLRSACAQRGVEFISAANSRIDRSLMKSHPYIRAVFTDVSYTSAVIESHSGPTALEVERFRSEAEHFVDEYLKTCKPDDKVILYLYAGGPRYIEMLYEIIRARPQVSAHIDVLYTSSTYIRDQAFKARWAETLRKPLLEERLAVAVPTREMQNEIGEAVGVVLPVAPAPSTTFDDKEATNALRQAGSHLLHGTGNSTRNVLFPGLMREAKGYGLAVSIARALHMRQSSIRYECTLRYAPRKDTPPELTELAGEARRFANVVEGVIPLEGFQQMFRGADIVVLPYQPSDFSNRTSGLLIDGLCCGVPAVVQKGTWLGNLVADYDCGVLSERADPEAYTEAIERVAANYNRYRRNAIAAGEKWLAENNWAKLIDFILAPPPALNISQDTNTAKQREGAFAVVGQLPSTEIGRAPTVSIIMPAFNAARTIGASIASIQSQGLTNWELLVIDDGSSDGTREVVTRLAAVDPRIRLLQSKGKGASAARNTGLDAAKGDFIAFLDADDFMYPDALSRRVEALDRHPDWNLVHCITELVDANSRKLGWRVSLPKEVSFRDMSANPCHISSLLGRAKIFNALRFETKLTNGEDWLFISDVLRTGEVSHRVGDCAVAYVVRPDSVVCRDYLSHENSLLEVLDVIYSPVRNGLPAALQFAQGLSSPLKQAVVRRRRIGLLTWLLLERRADDAAAVLQEFSSQAQCSLSKREVRNQIIYAGMRYYACSRGELAKRLRENKSALLALIAETGIERIFPQYARQFRSVMRKVSVTKLKDAMDRMFYGKLVGYLAENHPAIIAMGRAVKWCAAILRNTLLGIGGIALLVVAGLYTAGALVEPARWYLVGIASALLLLGAGMLAFSYVRIMLDGFASEISNQGMQIWKASRQVWDTNKQVSDINRQVSDIDMRISDIKKEIWVIKRQVSDSIVGPFRRSDHAHINESELIAALVADQTSNGVMIDVGAMHGSSLSPFCRLGWRVFAFEPDPTNRKELDMGFGDRPNLTIDSRAVADRASEGVPFYSSSESPGISTLHPFRDSHKEICSVEVTTIADFVREKDLHSIDYLKVDAEGYDLLILEGVPWDSIKPNVIMCEFEDSKTKPLGYTMHDMASYLTERGYEILVSEWHPVIRYGAKHDWHRLVPYPCELDDLDAAGNLIAFRNQPDVQTVAAIAIRICKVDSEP